MTHGTHRTIISDYGTSCTLCGAHTAHPAGHAALQRVCNKYEPPVPELTAEEKQEAELARLRTVELVCRDGTPRWSRTHHHTAALLSAGTSVGARTGLEFISAEGKTVMIFLGANDTLIVTDE